MSINLDALRAFVVLSEELNFGRTARRLNISQPALTKQIKRLEEKGSADASSSAPPGALASPLQARPCATAPAPS